MSNAPLIWSFRTDPNLTEKINDFRDKESLTNSQAIRVLIEMGLANIDQLDVSWARAAYREGVFKGLEEVQKRVKSTPILP